MRPILAGIALALLAPCSALAQGADSAQGQEIVVSGNRETEEKILRALTADVTRRPRVDKPSSRFYGPVCLQIIGVKTEFSDVLADRIKANARQVDAPVAKDDCTPNALVIFTRDARRTVDLLRKEEPWIFTNLLDYEFDRIIAGTEAAHAWQTTELRSVDGKPLQYQIINGREVMVNPQYQTGRLAPPLRVDMVGAVVLIDSAYLPGKTLQQLADYATFRLLASISETSESGDGADTMATILSLFDDTANAPAELTRFDRAYLRALYNLRPNAPSSAIRDATVRVYYGGKVD